MRSSNLLSYVAIAAVLIVVGAVSSESRAATIPIPNNSFEQIYKPGSTTVTADLGGNWTNGVGPNTPMESGQTANYSDGTSGSSVDVPGWINAPGWPPSYSWPVGCGVIARQVGTPAGLYYYAANGGDWGNSQGGAIESDAPLANVLAGNAYTLSIVANGGATPVLLELLAGGVPVTPTSSVDPVLSDTWQEYSRTYDAASLAGSVGQPLTVRLGVGPVAAGTQAHLDNVSLSFEPDETGEIPEPLTMTCLFAGMAVLGGYARRRRTQG